MRHNHEIGKVHEGRGKIVGNTMPPPTRLDLLHESGDR